MKSSQQATVTLHARKRSADTQNAPRERKVDQLDADPAGQTSRENPDGHTSEKNHPTGNQNNSNMAQSTTLLSNGTARETRSKAPKRPAQDTGDDIISIDVNPHAEPYVEPRHKGTPWRKPLIYPPDGKSRATLSWEDLDRLNDDEFLNDNLVTLFIRYLQEHMNPEHAKTMHFFSTFFYNALTRPAEKSKSRQINYPAVANWTKTVNLFKRDYVIVPVNEAAHWYVMIICNLRTLQESKDKDEEIIDITEPVEEDNNIGENASKPILESDIMADKEISEDSEYIEKHGNSKSMSARKRQRSQHLRRRKYATDQPIIITLDSLDQPRSATASALKSYLIEEAKDKYDLTIDKNSIKGMTAKNIPYQGNFSDCGLYLCMYLEQFVRDPGMFIRSILQREEKIFRWPRKLQNGVLRQRLYEMIGELHSAQNKKRAEKLSPIGRLLIKDEDYPTKKSAQTDMYKPENLNPGLDFVEKHISRDNDMISADRMLLEQAFPDNERNQTQEPEVQAIRTAEAHGSTSQPIIIADSQEPIHDQDGTTSRHFQQHKDEHPPPKPTQRSDTPQQLAERMRVARSPGHRTIKTPTTDGTIDLTTPIRQPVHSHNDTSPAEEQEPETRNIRSESCTTEYLTGAGTYAGKHGQFRRDDAGIYSYGSTDHEMQGAEDDFAKFSDEVEGGRSRGSSVVPESVQGEAYGREEGVQGDDVREGSHEFPDEMLLDD